MVEAPLFGDIGEFQIAEVAVGERGFVARRGVFPDIGAGGERRRDVLLVDEIRVDEVADHARW